MAYCNIFNIKFNYILKIDMLWPSGTVPDFAIASSTPDHGCCVPMPTQRAIPPWSVNEYQRKLGSKQAYHAMH